MKHFATNPGIDQSYMAPFRARGPLSAQLLAALALPPLRGEATLDGFRADVDRALAITADIVRDDDMQLTLFLLYGLSYGDVIDVDDEWEWNTTTIAARRALERGFERRLRDCLPAGRSAAELGHGIRCSAVVCLDRPGVRPQRRPIHRQAGHRRAAPGIRGSTFHLHAQGSRPTLVGDPAPLRSSEGCFGRDPG